MDKPGYTPGPWHVGLVDETSVLSADRETVALCCDRYEDDPERKAADARLIAAAPDLVEALRDLSIFYGDDTEAREVLRSDFTGPEPLLMDDDALRESVWNNAREALSKAGGPNVG
jgi:hypothetical protein